MGNFVFVFLFCEQQKTNKKITKIKQCAHVQGVDFLQVYLVFEVVPVHAPGSVSSNHSVPVSHVSEKTLKTAWVVFKELPVTLHEKFLEKTALFL